MQTVVLPQAEVRVTLESLLVALRALSPDEQETVRRELSRLTWQARFRDVLDAIRQDLAQSPLSEAEIEAEIEAGRSEHYAERIHPRTR